MTRRIDTVTIRLRHGMIDLPWESRQALLDEYSHLVSMNPVRKAFEAAGTSRPVELTLEQEQALLDIIDRWSARLPLGSQGLPEGIYGLRWMLAEEADARKSERPRR
jgi:hypothetical protein